MFQQTSHEIQSQLRQSGVTLLIIEQRLAILEHVHVNMKSRTRFIVYRLRQERSCSVMLYCSILDNVLGGHGCIGHFSHLAKLNFDFNLSRSANLMVMVLYLDAPVFHGHAHLSSRVVGNVLRNIRMIAFFATYLVALVAVSLNNS